MKFKRAYPEQLSVEINGHRIMNFVCLVDHYRRPSRKHNTAGRYRVGAKNAKQARELLQKAIGFGSVQMYYEDNTSKLADPVPAGQCVQEEWNSQAMRYDQVPARHATAPLISKTV